MPTVLVTGANRGLGLGFVRQYLADGWDVIACCRDPAGAPELMACQAASAAVEVLPLDVADFVAIDALAGRLADRSIDVLINNAGVFGPKRHAENDLRQSFGHIDYGILADVLRVNTLAPLKMAEAFIAHVARSEQKKIVTISSLVGSIETGEAGLYAYRTSKAAVNMVMATLARDLRARGICVVSFSPGWVRTDMGGPDAAIDVDASIAALRGLIAGLTMADSGAFIDYDGSRIPW